MVTTANINPPVPVRVELLPRIHSNVALAAFILAWFFPPLGFILGWVSIVSDGNDGRYASGLAKAAMLISALVVIGYIILIVQLTKTPALPCDLNNPNYPACLWTTQNSSRRCGSSTSMQPLRTICSGMALSSDAAGPAEQGRSRPRPVMSFGAIHVWMSA
jgi:hypothetical protein